MKWNLSDITVRADALYAARAQIENVRASVELLEGVAPDRDFEIAWRLGRALFFLGQEDQRKEDARRLHARGVAACERAARSSPLRVEGHFWLGVNLALEAQTARWFKALNLALRAKRSLELAARINPAYHAAGPLRVLARLKHRLPRLCGGGHARARADFARAIELAPANTVTRLYFTEMLIDAGDLPGARSELETILNAPLDAAWAFETTRDRSLARDMLRRLDSEAKPKRGQYRLR
jgi:tetratricopeptide (TPR) repeat protein